MAFYFTSEDIPMPDLQQKKIQEWIKTIINDYSKKLGDLTYIFTSDEYILKINQQYLQHDYYTDIITFDYSENDIISGDLFISLETVQSNAEKYNNPFLEELHRVIIHGILHLLGFNDKTEKENLQMRALEDKALRKLKC